jgi:hypothetical protein
MLRASGGSVDSTIPCIQAMDSYRTVSIAELTPGSVLVTPVFDEHRFKLIDAGTTIDQYLIDRLRLLGITEVAVDNAAESVVSESQNTSLTGARLQQGSAVRSLPVTHCSICRSNIALETPAPDSKASIWLCNSCGAIYFARNNVENERRGVLRVDPDIQNPFVAAVAPSISQEYIKRLLKLHEAEQFTGSDRRQHKRYPVAVPVVALPLGSDFRVIADPVQMTTANVSLGGAALLHTRFIEAPNLALDYRPAGVDLQVVLRISHVKSLGLVYEVAGEFISHLSQASKWPESGLL